MKQNRLLHRIILTSSLYLLTGFAQAQNGTTQEPQLSAAGQKNSASQSPAAALPNVVILATGGTIAGASNSAVQASYTSGQVTIDAMVNSIPDVMKIANIKGEQVSNVGSQDMNFDIMLKLGKRINELKDNTNVAGIVVTHGTDTM